MGFEMHPGQTMARLPSLGCSLFTGLFGLLLVPLGFFLVYYGETRLVNHGKVVERVPMMTVEQAQAVGTGTVKFRGKPEGEFLKVPRYDRPVGARLVPPRLAAGERHRLCSARAKRA